ncbi:MAG: hypothetical protein SFV81_14835 [Pirellulaceae bacterium]|nr:hypothetical protein [Pirellulaceae bacterium]
MSSTSSLSQPKNFGLKSLFEIACVVLLILSGFVHASLFLVDNHLWESPFSFRKAALFGVSTGLTLWSCLWAMEQLSPRRFDSWIRRGLCVLLVLEVFLISMQTWRGQRSHFNDVGVFNRGIEVLMLLLITAAMALIVFITILAWFSNLPTSRSSGSVCAIRWGLLFLCISGGLGYVTTVLGYYLITMGLLPETWPARGVLKFPHGAALHAIQTLAIVAWIGDRWGGSGSIRAVQFAVFAHWFWLFFAAYQSFTGRSRFEVDGIGLLLISAIVILCTAALWSLISITLLQVATDKDATS